jgi:hypothetical protein
MQVDQTWHEGAPRDINDSVGLASDWMGGEFADQAVLDHRRRWRS